MKQFEPEIRKFFLKFFSNSCFHNKEKWHLCTIEETVLLCIISALYKLRDSLHQLHFSMIYYLDYLVIYKLKDINFHIISKKFA